MAKARPGWAGLGRAGAGRGRPGPLSENTFQVPHWSGPAERGSVPTWSPPHEAPATHRLSRRPASHLPLPLHEPEPRPRQGRTLRGPWGAKGPALQWGPAGRPRDLGPGCAARSRKAPTLSGPGRQLCTKEAGSKRDGDPPSFLPPQHGLRRPGAGAASLAASSPCHRDAVCLLTGPRLLGPPDPPRARMAPPELPQPRPARELPREQTGRPPPRPPGRSRLCSASMSVSVCLRVSRLRGPGRPARPPCAPSGGAPVPRGRADLAVTAAGRAAAPDHTAGALPGGSVCPLRTRFWLSQLGVLPASGGGQGCCSTAHNAQGGPRTRSVCS